MMKRVMRSKLCIVIALFSAAAFAADDALTVGAFSALRPDGGLPDGWAPIGIENVRNRTQYALVDDAGTTVLRAVSHDAASGLTRRLRVDPAAYPVLRWRWKVSNLIPGADLRTKDGDDYPARVYVMFDYPLSKLSFGERMKLRLARLVYGEVPAATLCYVWDGTAPAGTIAPSAYTDRVRMIVVESGAAHVNQWVGVQRNLVQDFKAAFGEEPPAITAVAVATDTDNTGTAATAYFGDISLHKREVNP